MAQRPARNARGIVQWAQGRTVPRSLVEWRGFWTSRNGGKKPSLHAQKAATNQSRRLAGNYRSSPGYSLHVRPAWSWEFWTVEIKRRPGNSPCSSRGWSHQMILTLITSRRSLSCRKSDGDLNPSHPLHPPLTIRSLLKWTHILLNVPICCPTKRQDEMRCTDWYSTNVSAAGSFKKTVQQCVVVNWPNCLFGSLASNNANFLLANQLLVVIFCCLWTEPGST